MRVLIIVIFLCLTGCSLSKKEQGKVLYETHCASCHIAPSPQDLPKHLWKESVLPEMAARMGIKDSTYSPYSGHTFSEQEMMMRSGVYSLSPSISMEKWSLLKEYIIESAPYKIKAIPKRDLSMEFSQFKTRPVALASSQGASISHLSTNREKGTIIAGDLAGNLIEYNPRIERVSHKENLEKTISWYNKINSSTFVTFIGKLNPSQMTKGKIFEIKDGSIEQIAGQLHRPVHTTVFDFDNDGNSELLVSEFGHLTGGLSLWHKTVTSPLYDKQILLGQPGVIRSIVKDMNSDGKSDIVVLSSQGDEGISILYQTEVLKFTTEKVIRFNPLYGSSWFEVLDYDGDGDQDIITVHGDNADNTYVHKPYHGIRIHINNGFNNFKEEFFYPLYGATRFVANDFDQDGDVDIAVVSSFPDYEEAPEFSLIYLENQDSENFDFQAFGIKDSSLGRWLLIDSVDFDKDGDEDIVLASFTYYFTPVPENLQNKWSTSNVDLMLLENTHR